MDDLIRGDKWIRPVHHLPGRGFGNADHASTIIGELSRHARARPSEPFLTEIRSGSPQQTITYGQALNEVQQRQALLATWGIEPGESVGIVGHNSLDFVLATLATLSVGGVVVLLSHQEPPSRIDSQARFAGVRFLLHDSVCAESAKACTSVERACSLSEFGLLAASLRRFARINSTLPKATDAAIIVFTSGTTGAPKAVVQSHYSVAHNAFSLAEHHSIRSGVRLLCVLPLHHVNGLEFTVFSVMIGGGHTVISRGFDGLEFWKVVRDYGIHILSLVPNLLGILADRPRLRGCDPLTLRYAVSAAAPLSVSIARRVWDQLGLRIVQGYGLSEVTNFSCVLPPLLTDLEYQRWMLSGRKTSIGPALPGQEVEIRGEHGMAQAGAEGEICIRGDCVMSGYLNNPAATEEAFRDGWFHTGDLGYSVPDDHGCQYFHVAGRIREIAKRSGALVSLQEVDEVLLSVPGVADAGAAAFANDWVGEEIAAIVVQKPGSALTQETIAEHCRRVLPFFAIPKTIQFVERVPRTATGKIRRAEIAEQFAAFRDRLFVEPRPAEAIHSSAATDTSHLPGVTGTERERL
jgi:acyl-CoA synthetase (AMP-forming)/AMP-acid ligase II